VPALIEELKSDRETRRWRAARTLGRIGPDARPALPALLGALRDPASIVRVQAARALGRVGSRDAIAGLVEAVKSDPAKEVREEASRALSRIPGQ
jgi:HEAT repeat protein